MVHDPYYTAQSPAVHYLHRNSADATKENPSQVTDWFLETAHFSNALFAIFHPSFLYIKITVHNVDTTLNRILTSFVYKANHEYIYIYIYVLNSIEG
jgi:hypothetical protein